MLRKEKQWGKKNRGPDETTEKLKKMNRTGDAAKGNLRKARKDFIKRFTDSSRGEKGRGGGGMGVLKGGH